MAGAPAHARRRIGRFVPIAALLATMGFATLEAARAEGPLGGQLRVAEAVLEPVPLQDLPGFAGDDHGAALDAFRLSCGAIPPPPGQPITATGNPGDLAAACERASRTGRSEARAFFETAFSAYRITRPAREKPEERRNGYLTAYFEPELTGSLTPGEGYTAAVLARPDDLITFEPGEIRPGLDPALKAARRTETGFEPYPDRAAIEDGVLGPLARPLLWLRDSVDLFVLQLQGSGRVRLPDGTSVHVLYDGKNGRAFSSPVKKIVTEGHLPLAGLSLARWTSWMRANPAEARRLLRANPSYVFFRLAPAADPALGPPGAAGAPLSSGRSLAVDSALWRYGLPFWLEGRLTSDSKAPGRLVIAQDTGSAIVGPARGDFYVGSGEVAGIAAGHVRNAIGFVVLLPKPAVPRPAPGAGAP